MKKTNFPTILYLVITAFIIRLFGLRLILYADEAQLVYFPKLLTMYQSFSLQYQPPVFEILSRAIYYFFGTEAMIFRLIFVFFGVLSIYFTYKLACDLYDKNVGIFSALLMALSFWHFVASTQIERDGAILALFYILSIYFFIKYHKTSSKMWLFASGVSIGLALLTKTSAVLILAVIGLYSLLMHRNILKAIKETVIPFSVGLGIIGLYFFILYLISPKILFDTINYGASRLTQINLMIIFYVLIWGTPLFWLALVSLRRFEKKDIILWLWVIIPVCVYALTDRLAPIDRYLMVIIPPLAILSAKYLSLVLKPIKLRAVKSNALYLVLFVIFYCVLLLINNQARFIPHDIGQYFQNLLSLDLNFFMPITGPAGPSFYVSFFCIFLSVLIGFLLIFVLFVFTYLKKKRLLSVTVKIFLALMLSYNIFLIQQMSYSSVLDATTVTTEVVDYLKDKDIDILFTNTASLPFYLDVPLESTIDLKNLALYKEGLIESNGYAAIVEFPKVSDEIIRLHDGCKLEKTIKKNNIVAARIWYCGAEQ